jgi:biopolymer transport protein ExbD
MAEVNTTTRAGHSKGRGVKKSKKLSIRVDLTPMVDLGFLLITFFIFTTTMSQPTAMKVFLPDDKGDPTPIKVSGALTLLLGKNNIVYYYEGNIIPDPSSLPATTYNGIRDIIINKKKSTKPQDFFVIIKPQKESLYKNTVDALDEMTINNVKHYSVVDITDAEEDMMQTKPDKIE